MGLDSPTRQEQLIRNCVFDLPAAISLKTSSSL